MANLFIITTKLIIVIGLVVLMDIIRNNIFMEEAIKGGVGMLWCCGKLTGL